MSSTYTFRLLAVAIWAIQIGTAAAAETHDKYGGLKCIKTKATGWFRVEQINGRWVFVTPEGHGYLALGANHVGKYLNVQADEMGLMKRVDGDRTKAAAFMLKAMRDMGLNAGEAYNPRAPELQKELPWVADVRFPAPSKFAFDVFDPKFQKKLQNSIIQQCKKYRNDPMILGIACADLPVWDKRRIRYFEKLPPRSPGAKELKQHRDTGNSDNAFLGHVAATLYRQLRTAFRKGAPNHLFFGERFYLRSAPDEVIRAVGRSVDVFCTQALILSPQRPPEWQLFQQDGYDHEYELIGSKPMMVIDWAAPFSLAQTFTNKSGTIKAQEIAAQEAADWLRSAMTRPYMIGVFKCQLIGLHGNDKQFNNRSRRTYLKDNGDPFEVRTEITRTAHADALRIGYAAALKK